MEHYLLLALKLLIGFLMTIMHLNFTGKTQISQMNAIDFIGNFILGGVIGGVIYNDDIGFGTYIMSLLLGIFLINFLNFLVKKTSLFRAFAIGDPILLVYKGEFCIEAIRDKKNKIDIYNIAANLRILGHSSFSNIDFLQIEPNGQLSIIPKEAKKPLPSVILFVEGTFSTSELEGLKKDEEWLKSGLKKHGINEYDDIYLIEFYNKELNVIYSNGKVQNCSI